MRIVLTAVITATLLSCGSYLGGGGALVSGPGVNGGGAEAYTGGPGGATVGGLKDIAQFRAAIDAGQVPSSSLLDTEGLLAEHDFPAEGAPCTDLFCARPAIARHLLRSTGTQEIFVNVGLLSNLGADWQRPPADLMVVLDKSASMSIDIQQTLLGISLMIDRMRDDDRFGMIVFDDTPNVIVPLGALGDRTALKQKIQQVSAGGGFNGLIDGVNRGFAQLAAAQAPGRISRMMLFACSVPPAGPGPFNDAVSANADQGRGVSFFGILLGGSSTDVQYYSSLHGGNAFFLGDLQTVQTVFDTDLDLIITPLAYDFAFALQSTGAKVERVWGIPDGKQELAASTIFPSRNKGAIVLQLSAPDGADLSTLTSLSFGYRPALGAPIVNGAAPTALETKGGVRKAAALVNLADGLTALLDLYPTDPAKAKAQLADLDTWFSGEAEALNDDQLRADLKWLGQLGTNMH